MRNPECGMSIGMLDSDSRCGMQNANAESTLAFLVPIPHQEPASPHPALTFRIPHSACRCDVLRRPALLALLLPPPHARRHRPRLHARPVGGRHREHAGTPPGPRLPRGRGVGCRGGGALWGGPAARPPPVPPPPRVGGVAPPRAVPPGSP